MSSWKDRKVRLTDNDAELFRRTVLRTTIGKSLGNYHTHTVQHKFKLYAKLWACILQTHK